MQRHLLIGLTVLCFAVSVDLSLGQTQVTFRQGLNGYAGATDAKIRTSNPTINYGDSLDIEIDGSPDYGALMGWSVAAIDSGSIVASVELNINVFNPTSNDYEIYESKRAWIESEVTWQDYAASLPWQVAGASGVNDRGSTVLGAISGSSIPLNAAGIAVVQGWVDDPLSNHGFVIQDYGNATDGIDFDTKEVPTVGNRPALIITYYAPGSEIPPVASLVADPPGGNRTLTVSFDASASSDIDGNITSYAWDFGDGDGSTGISTSHDYDSAGVFVARLIVTDDDANGDTTSQAIRVTAPGQTQFAVLGDYGSDGAPLADVAAQVLSWSPDFIVTVGDNNYPDGTGATIDANIGQYFSDFIHPYMGTYGSTATVNRFFPSLGNHDWRGLNCAGGNCSGAYFDYFDLPANPADERYYEFVWGDVHFFALDSDGDEPDGTSSTSVQAQWLESRLLASTATWKIVYFHHAAYSSSSNHGSDARMQWPFSEWGADAVIGGHDHTYERIHRDGIVYFVNGLGGRSIYGLGTPIQGSEVQYNSDYGAMRVTADSINITFEFITRTGVVVDTYSLTNSPAIALKALLQGPYDPRGDSMFAEINSHLPLTQPYDSTIFDGTTSSYHGSESVDVLPSDIVGWIIVELRTGDPADLPMTVVSRQAALLKSDGTVVDTSGASILRFPAVSDGDYRLTLFHRNHLAVMTRNALTLADGDTASYDFSVSSDAAYGSNPMKELEAGVWGLYAGDGRADGQIIADDFNLWLADTKAVTVGFAMTDYDLDAMVTTTDFNLWLTNTKAAAKSQVP